MNLQKGPLSSRKYRYIKSIKYIKYIKYQISQSIDHFLDLLVERQKTKLNIQRKKATATSLLQMELESKDLPPIELTRFDGDHCIWPEFI